MPLSSERVDGGVAVVTLSPKASSNTFSPQNIRPLIATLDQLMADPSCVGVVLTGSGQFFSAGGNIDDFSEGI